jgi:transcriptional regulator with XRE-family HTH domain
LVKWNHPTISGVPGLPHLATRLRSLRRRHGLTQEEFAEAAGLSYKFYQQIEAGRKKHVWLETVERLAAGFGLEAWQLIGPEEPAHTIVARPTNSQKVRRRQSKSVEPAAAAESQRAVAEDSTAYTGGPASKKSSTKRRGAKVKK